MTGDRIHHASVCRDCGGLIAGHFDRVADVDGFEVRVGDGLVLGGPGTTATLYLGPVPEPCHTDEAPR